MAVLIGGPICTPYINHLCIRHPRLIIIIFIISITTLLIVIIIVVFVIIMVVVFNSHYFEICRWFSPGASVTCTTYFYLFAFKQYTLTTLLPSTLKANGYEFNSRHKGILPLTLGTPLSFKMASYDSAFTWQKRLK